MRVVIQRVKNAQVDIENKTVGSIDQGLVVLLGIEMADTLEDVIWTVKKITQLRIFSDCRGCNESFASRCCWGVVVD